ncbi:DUF7507 domain-containing protein, partial [Aquimarina sp. 2201CG14-23]|uniref:DUF7507 domain-containing protein n=1 Tax=Aquimarina mycalae TaxID=3040073 RepID=UPI002477E479
MITNNGSATTNTATFTAGATGTVVDMDATDTDGDVEGTGDGDQLDWSLTGGADVASFSIDDSGILTFNTPPVAAIYVVEITVTDSASGTDVQTLTVTVTATGPDSDNDGEPDSSDLDNDNDGILDSVECNGTLQPGVFTATNDGNVDGNESGTITLPSGTAATWNITHSFTNGQLEQFGLSTNNELYFYYNRVAAGNWDLDAANFSVAAGAADIQLALFGYVDADAQIPEPPGPDFGSRFGTYTISWVGGTGDAIINDPINQTDQADGATITNGGNFTQTGGSAIDNNLLQWNVVFPIGATSFTISATGGASAEGFRFTALENVCIDTDGDGIQDFLDLDSDNDGIYDVVEAGGTASTFPGQEGRQIDDDNNADNTATTGIPSTVSPTGTTPADTTPGTPDYINLNSDGDICSDANEGADNNIAEGNDGGQYGDNDPQTVVDGEVDANGLIIAATYSNTAVAAVTDNTVFTACDDGDGVPTAEEDAGPNGGDGNNDGIPDSQQPNVTSIVDATGLGYVTVEVVITGDCAQITNMDPLLETELASLDDDFDYPVGLMDFTLQCGGAGQSADVIIYWHNINAIDVFRKYGSTVPGANNATYNNFVTTQGTTTINGIVVPTTSYTITDGQPGDESATPAVIVDPVGPAMPNFDSDGDGLANGVDQDDDNDGILDIDECTIGGGSFGTELVDDADTIFEITAESNPSTLAALLFAENTDVTLISSSINVGSGLVPQIGTFDDADQITDSGGSPNAFAGFSTGVIFSSGNVLELDDNLSNQFFENEPGLPPFATFGPAFGFNGNGTGVAGGGTDPDFAGGSSEFDVASLEFVINVPAETSITGQFVFASEEYNDFVNQGVNDAAKVIINNTNVALTPSGSFLSIDTVNNNTDSAFYIDNETDPTAVNIEADGFTTTITFSAVLIAGNNTIKIGVADNGDNVFDSWLLFRANSFVLCFDKDTDGDNIADRLDLDSDNDGIYDAIEAGGTLSGATGQEGRHDDDNNNTDNTATSGVPSLANGGAGNTPTDTGSDGSLDYLTLDSDGDGCSDANEAYADANADGGDGGVYNPGNTAAEPLTDIAGTVDANGLVVAATYTDPVDGDTDGTDDYQQIGGPDADNDGIADACDLTFDNNDNDSVGDVLDLDDDNDGIPDTAENSLGVDPSADADGDGIPNYQDFDDNGSATTPVCLDGDLNGVCDALDPVFDFDGDGIPNHFDLDSDNDGIVDVLEAGGTDVNQDGQNDTVADADNDGIPDSVDVNVTGGFDIDLDGIDDAFDIDFAGTLDSDGDGIEDGSDPDADGDGLADDVDTIDNGSGAGEIITGAALPAPNSDSNPGDGPNFLDIDADDDGIVDNIEGQSTSVYLPLVGNDTDGDGIDDQYDADCSVATCGLVGTPITPENTDGLTDGADYIDTDSDEDGESDTIEAYDSNDDGVVDGTDTIGTTPDLTNLGTDSDGDGLDDEFDTDGTSVTDAGGPTNGGQTADNPFPDTDSPGAEPDWRDPVVNDLEITKVDTYVDTNANGIIDAGDTINYVFTVTNNGTADITNVTVSDPVVTVSGGPLATLLAGNSDNSTFTATYTIIAADITAGSFSNTATVSAEDANGNTITSLSDDPDDAADATDDDGDGNPDDPTVTDLRQGLLDITKTDSYVDTNANGIIDAGDTINYVFTVSNTGNIDLTGISVTDALVTVTPATTIDLVVGASDNSTYTATYTITTGDITAGSFSNTATATATDPLGGPDITDDSDDPDNPTDVDPDNDGSPDDPTVTDLSQPLLDITKTDSYVDTNANGIIDAGDTINYVFTVSNTGNIDLFNIQVDDPTVTVTPATTIDLVVGASDNSTYTASYVITAADITAGSFSNTAVASAPNPLDPTAPPVSDD